ncbi:MAG: hypothetical protein QM831_38410 [Kofleriaceae bacterium]
MTLDELLAIVRNDRTRMGELVALSRELLAHQDPRVRTDAAAMAFFAVRQVLRLLPVDERVWLCSDTLVRLEAAIDRGLADQPNRVLARPFCGVLREVLANPQLD